MRYALSIVLVLLATVAPGRSDDSHIPLQFNWPSSARAIVELTSEKSVGGESRSVLIRVRLDVAPYGSDGSLLLKFSDPSIVAINGVPFDRVQRDSEPMDVARVMSRAIPSFVVAGSGDYLDIHDAVGAARVVAQAAGIPADFPGQAALGGLVEQVASSDWQAWVELWIGDRMTPGEWTRSDRTVEFEGALTPVTMTRRRLQPPGQPERSRLQLELEYPSPAVRTYTTGFLIDLARDAKILGDDVFENRKWIEKAHYSPLIETITAELDTATMRPLFVERTRTFFAVNGEYRIEGSERRAHRFTWIDESAASKP